jgi:hypothetical protein
MHVVHRILRHASINTTSSIYSHLEVEDLQVGFEQTFGKAEPTTTEASARAVGDERGTNQAHDAPTLSGFRKPDAQTTELTGIPGRREWCRTTDLYRVKVALYR